MTRTEALFTEGVGFFPKGETGDITIYFLKELDVGGSVNIKKITLDVVVRPDLFRSMDQDEIEMFLTGFFPFFTKPHVPNRRVVSNILFDTLKKTVTNEILEKMQNIFGHESKNHLLNLKATRPMEFRQLILYYGVNLLPDVVSPLTKLSNASPPSRSQCWGGGHLLESMQKRRRIF